MDDNFLSYNSKMQGLSLNIKKCNEYTAAYGLVLNQEEITTLMETRRDVLKTTGRIEFSGGILEKLIIEFCDSPYLLQSNYVSTLQELLEVFYNYKNDSLEELSDDELIAIMKEYFDGECGGSVEYLQETSLEDICRNIRCGHGAVRRYEEETDDACFDDYKEAYGEDYDEE